MKLSQPLNAIGVYWAGSGQTWKVYVGNPASGLVPDANEYQSGGAAKLAAMKLRRRIASAAVEIAAVVLKLMEEPDRS